MRGIGPFLVLPLSLASAGQVTDKPQSAGVKLRWRSRKKSPFQAALGEIMHSTGLCAVLLSVLLAHTSLSGVQQGTPQQPAVAPRDAPEFADCPAGKACKTFKLRSPEWRTL
jgi:hypothetical protein